MASRNPSVLDGVAAIFDFTGSLGPRPRTSDNPAEADAEAIAAVWRAVGDDLRRAMDHHSRYRSANAG